MRLRPYFYQTLPFFLACGFLLLLGAFFLYRWRVRWLRRNQKELARQVQQKAAELKEASLRDPLTGLWNRRFVHDVFDTDIRAFVSSKKFVSRGNSRRRPLGPLTYFGIFMIDIDHFKTINDTYGHSAGDEVLRQLSGLLRGAMRMDDVVVRWGGEEFLIVLKNCEYEFLHIFAEKILDRIAAHEFRIPEKEDLALHKTCSIGYTSYPFFDKDPDLLSFKHAIDLSDLGLIYAKKSGRNMSIRIEPGHLLPIPEDIIRLCTGIDYGLTNGFIKLMI